MTFLIFYYQRLLNNAKIGYSGSQGIATYIQHLICRTTGSPPPTAFLCGVPDVQVARWVNPQSGYQNNDNNKLYITIVVQT